MRFEMAERGSVFSTRDLARWTLTELEVASAGCADRDLVLDFTSVGEVTPSFADGFVGVIVAERRSLGLPDPQILGAIDPVRRVIDDALRLRGIGIQDLEIVAA